MKELTQDTMPAFLEQFRSTLLERVFTIHGMFGRVHDNVRLAEISDIQVTPAGVWQIDLRYEGGLEQSLSTHFKREGDDEPVVWDVVTSRVWYEFTDHSVEIHVEQLVPGGLAPYTIRYVF